MRAPPASDIVRREVLRGQPLFLNLFGISAAAMFAPAALALAQDLMPAARAFFYAGTLGAILFLMIAVAQSGGRPGQGPLGPLLSLLATFTVLPVFLALPFHDALGNTTFFNAYLEMVSSVTTTGATLFDQPGRLSDPLHLWRAQVAWMSGFLIWVAAAAILASLNLGGFEVTARAVPGRQSGSSNQMRRAEMRTRLTQAVNTLFPVYAGLTLLLCLLLMVSGDRGLVALTHAMGVMSTSGISPVGGLEGAQSGWTGEAVMALFLLFALSRVTFSSDTMLGSGQSVLEDPEIRLAFSIILALPVLMFVRHWLGALDVDQQEDTVSALQALWGSMFTVTSFLTTAGYVSTDWQTAQGWSGLSTPGVILMGLAIIGGGVATTAGGVKLLRVYALYRHGLREMERLVHPSSVSGARGLGRRLQRDGAFIAWVFFMLFALSLTVASLGFSALGVPFEEAMLLTVAALTTTGPLLDVAGAEPVHLAELDTMARALFGAAMVVGRLETLAIIALLTPALWRD